MCGILGRFYRQPAHRSSFTKKDLTTLAHRDPDGSGVYSDSHIQFGHTRFVIIDLTEGGHQPMTYEGGRYVITYNGEVYNYLEVRAELQAKGERFVDNSDTEVLLSPYKVWGRECVTFSRDVCVRIVGSKREKSFPGARSANRIRLDRLIPAHATWSKCRPWSSGCCSTRGLCPIVPHWVIV